MNDESKSDIILVFFIILLFFGAYIFIRHLVVFTIPEPLANKEEVHLATLIPIKPVTVEKEKKKDTISTSINPKVKHKGNKSKGNKSKGNKSKGNSPKKTISSKSKGKSPTAGGTNSIGNIQKEAELSDLDAMFDDISASNGIEESDVSLVSRKINQKEEGIDGLELKDAKIDYGTSDTANAAIANVKGVKRKKKVTHSRLITKEKNNQEISNSLAALFNKLRPEIKVLVDTYGTDKQSYRLKLHFDHGTIDGVALTDSPASLVNGFKDLLIGIHIKLDVSGYRQHIIFVRR